MLSGVSTVIKYDTHCFKVLVEGAGVMLQGSIQTS